MFTTEPSKELDQRVLHLVLSVEIVVELIVEVGWHGGISYAVILPRWTGV